MNYLIDLLYNLTFIVSVIATISVVFAIFASVCVLIFSSSGDTPFFENIRKNKYWILGVYIVIILLYTLTPTLDSIREMRNEYQKEKPARATPTTLARASADYWY